MALDILKERGVALERQEFDFADLVQQPYSKLNDDAFTRVRVILMNGIEAEAVRFGHSAARQNGELRLPLARVRRIEHHQQTLVNWLNPPDQSPLETTIGFEQVAVEITAAIAQREPDPYLAQVYRFGLLEDFDHLYRFSALMDRLEGKDANNLLQSYTDIRPGRPTSVEHRAPEDDLRNAYDREKAQFVSKVHANTVIAAENMTHDYYMVVGPTFSDPLARQLYAEIASIEEQHVTQYECLVDPKETLLEKWLVHEATEVWNYYACAQQEDDVRIKRIWERFVDYELGHLHFVMDLFRRQEKRDPEELIPARFPDPLPHKSNRAFVRQTLREEVDLRAAGTRIVPLKKLPADAPSNAYQRRITAEGSPSETVSQGWRWRPGGELARDDGRADVQPGRMP